MDLVALRHLPALRRWHRRCGILACCGILLWSLSGSLHPFLSRYQPQPVSFTPPPLSLPAQTLRPLRALLAEQNIDRLNRVRLVSWGGHTYYQVQVADGARRYFDAVAGDENKAGDTAYATALARHYLGDSLVAVSSAAPLLAFDDEYAWINRVLPVQRVAFARDDGMRVYVDTATSTLVTLIDDRKALYTRLFQLLHNWHFAGSGEWPRVPLAAVFVLAAVATSLLGVLLWSGTRTSPQATPLRRTHRMTGAVVALMLASSGLSGAYHLAKGALDRTTDRLLPQQAWPEFDAALLQTDGLTSAADASLFAIDGALCLRVRPVTTAAVGIEHTGHDAHAGQGGMHSGHEAHESAVTTNAGNANTVSADTRYLDAGEVPCTMDDAGYASTLAAGFASGGFVVDGTLNSFDDEYGFINKLLPVVRVVRANGERLYVHLDSATIAAKVDTADYVESWVFANLHKWHALEVIGRWPRDIIMITFALGIAATALMGLLLFVRQAR